MATNFPANPSNGATHAGFTYNSTVGAWESSAIVTDTASVTTYATADDLPLSNNTTGDQAFVTATNRLYIWNGSGWYNIALINTTPSISGVSSSYQFQTDGTPIEITITATDPEGLPITYSIASDTSGSIATVTQGTGANTNVFTITPSTNDADAGTFSLTFRASDGVNIATAAASFELVFRIVNSNYTTALITSIGANLADNNDFVDSSTSNHTITAAGNATQTTFSPYRHGGYSTYFDGTGDYLEVTSTVSPIGTDDFTIEGWYYLDSAGSSNIRHVWDFRPLNNDGPYPTLRVTSSNEYQYLAGGANRITSSAVTLDAWHHVAVVRNSSTTTLYIDGSSAGTWADTTSYDLGGNRPMIGGSGYHGSTLGFHGYITDWRFVDNTAVYTTTFTPPSQRLTAITNTVLLTCHLPYIADGSTNGHSITVAGNTKTEPFAPYDYEEYSSSNYGGSNFFTTSNDYLTIPYSSTLDFGSNDFTIEWWMNPTTTAGDQVIFVQSNNLGIYGPLWIRYNGGVLKAWATTAGGTFNLFNSTTISGSIPANLWTHVAITRNSSGVWKTYLNGIQSYTSTAAGSLYVNSNDTVIGGSATANFDFEGSLADFRIVNGTVVYTSDFTPPTAPLTAISGTSLLLKGTDAAIIDKSQSVGALTLYGNAKSSTTQSKYLSSSMAFDGTGDYIQSPYDPELFNKITFPSGVDFTVEAWIYMNTAHSVNHSPLIVGAGDGVDASPAHYFNWGFYFSTGGTTLNLGKYDGSTFTGYSKTHSISATTWTHVAVTRNGTDLKFFVDGTQLGTTETDSTNWSGIANYPLSIGRWYHSGGTADDLDGYLSDIRITKGLARYTANFTPPAAALKG